MPDIQHDRIGEHERAVEDVQRPLVLFQVSRVPLPDVDDAEDVPAGDDDAADIHEVEDAPQFLGILVRARVRFWGEDAGSDAPPVKDGFENDEEEEGDDLQEDGGAE